MHVGIGSHVIRASIKIPDALHACKENCWISDVCWVAVHMAKDETLSFVQVPNSIVASYACTGSLRVQNCFSPHHDSFSMNLIENGSGFVRCFS